MRRLTRTKKNILRKRARRRRGMVPVIAFILLFSLFIQTFAFTPNTVKEEVIYVNLNLDGSVDAIYVVNSFDLSQDGKIIDYGDYTSFRQLSQSGQIMMENQTIKIDGKAGKVYYEGKLRNESIPWLFNIKYFLNDKEYKGEDLGGKSGELRINLDVKENPDSGSAFFKNLTLQIGFSFDASKTDDIEAEGAVIANAGKNKQIMFTVFPGRDSSFTVKAKVSDFEMDGITINAIPMDMDFDIDDDPTISKELEKLKDGVAELDDGAREIRDGVKDLREGTGDLRDGVEELKDGVAELADGTKELRENTDEFVDGVRELDDGVAELSDGTKDLKEGTKELDEGIGKLTSAASGLSGGARDLANGLGQLALGGPGLMAGAEDLVNQFYIFLMSGYPELSEYSFNVDTYEGILNTLTEGAYQIAYNQTKEVYRNNLRDIFAEGMGLNSYDDADPGTKETIDGLVNDEIIQLEDEIVQEAKAGLEQDEDYKNLLKLYGPGAFYDGLVQYKAGVDQSASGASSLASGLSSFYSGLRKIDRGTADFREGVDELHDGVLDLKDGTGKLLDGAIELKDGIIELDDGVIELKDGVIELFDGAVELHDGVIELHDGTIKMAKGTMEFRDETADLEKNFKEKIKEKLDEILGRNFEAQSFVSENNINIDSVQFVMKTGDIVKEEMAVPLEIPEKPLGFFDRLLALFKK